MEDLERFFSGDFSFFVVFSEMLHFNHYLQVIFSNVVYYGMKQSAGGTPSIGLVIRNFRLCHSCQIITCKWRFSTARLLNCCFSAGGLETVIPFNSIDM